MQCGGAPGFQWGCYIMLGWRLLLLVSGQYSLQCFGGISRPKPADGSTLVLLLCFSLQCIGWPSQGSELDCLRDRSMLTRRSPPQTSIDLLGESHSDRNREDQSHRDGPVSHPAPDSPRSERHHFMVCVVQGISTSFRSVLSESTS